ncbi:MAG: hypothetical protein ACJ8C4_09740 [Gemmataceae bacterium]
MAHAKLQSLDHTILALSVVNGGDDGSAAQMIGCALFSELA